MTIRCWPLDPDGTGQPQYAGRDFRQMSVAPMVPMGNVARPLGGLSGVRWGTPTTTVSVSGTTWSCGAHVGFIDREAAAEASVYAYSVDAPVSGTITAADGTNARKDIVYAQISDPAEGDGSATPKLEIKYLAGSALGTTNAPATPERSFVLAQINVPKTGGGSPSVTWVAPWLTSDRAGFQTSAQMNAWTTAAPNQRATVLADSDASKNGDYVRYGSSWVATLGDTGWINASLINGWVNWAGLPIRFRRLNGVTFMQGRGSGTANTVAFNVPVGFRPSQDFRFAVMDGTTETVGTCLVAASGAVTPSRGTPNLTIPWPADQ